MHIKLEALLAITKKITPLIGWPRYLHEMLFEEFTAYLHIELHKC